jgi:hypothetical protein
VSNRYQSHEAVFGLKCTSERHTDRLV